MKRLVLLIFAIFSAFGQPALDATGNGLLSGTYNFREALWITDAQASNDLMEAASQYGTITFDGQGNYTMAVSEFSSRTGSRNYVRAGTYTIAASGAGLIRRVSDDGDIVYGAVANGTFIGSATESGFNDLFIASKQPTTAVTTATFNNRYTVAYMNLPTTSMTQIRDASFQIAPNGAGSLGTIAVSGYVGGNYTAASQTISSANYSFLSGVGTFNFGPANTTDLVTGPQQVYVSADGQFIFGGQTNGWDMFVGVKTPTSASTAYSGLYFQAGLDVRRSALPSGAAVLDSYYGSFNAITSVKSIIGHQRVQTAPDAPYEYTYSDIYNLSASGSHDDFLGLLNYVANDGSVRIGFGRQDYLGLNVAIKAPSFSGSGVYLNPTGVVNAASFTPFTVGIAPGELITLFGTNFANANFVDATFPVTLGGVSVKINGRNAPVYVVSPTQISAIVPYETIEGIAEIQVNKSGTLSNRVTMYVNRTAPGVFAVPPTGLGYAAALHPDYSLVTPTNPARPGEVVAVYLTGLGLTDPQVATGAAGPVSPLAKALELIDVSVANRSAKVVYAGLAPTLKGLYQLNFEIPANVPSGDQYVDVGGPDALNSQILLPIGGARSAAVEETLQHVRLEPAYRSPLKTRNGFDPAATGSSSSSPSSDR